ELSKWERREFFLSASGIRPDEMYPVYHSPEEELSRILDNFQRIPFPAMVIDSMYDFIAVNRLMMDFYGITEDRIIEVQTNPLSVNLLWYIFSSETGFFDLGENTPYWREWEKVIISNVQGFKRASLRYRCTPYWKMLFHSLYFSEDPLLRKRFRKYWQMSETETGLDCNFGRLYKIQNPLSLQESETIEFMAVVTEEITSYGSLFITMYMPVSQKTIDIFAKMLEQAKKYVDRNREIPYRRIAKWPKKFVLEDASHNFDIKK
ncbi:MAG: hypothetical protein GXO35_02340, partial [Gammaproteobacteria bacterium]|nr:hypothetical protein [Gammaproteobacteria bacterium]